MSSTLNRIANVDNPFQGTFKRVLCVCSAGLLRSPTTAEVLSREPYNFNTRAAGIVPAFALIPVDDVLLAWADEVVCMEPWQAETLAKMTEKRVVCLNIQDSHPFRNDALVAEIKQKYDEAAKV